MLSHFILLFFLIFCSAFFSGSETALFSLSKVKIHKFRESRSLSGAKLVDYLCRPRQTLVTILLGNEFVNISIAIVGVSIINNMYRSSVEVETLISVVTITPLVLIFGEIIPKNLSLMYASQFATVAIWPLHLFYYIVSPIRIVLSWFADLMIKIFGGKIEEVEPMVMEDEFRNLVDLGHKEGVIVEEERELIHKVFDFSDKVVADIMTIHDRFFSLSIDLPYDRLMEEIRSTQFSRVPFYEGDSSNIVGVLHVRDIFSFDRERRAGEKSEIRDILHPAMFVSPKAPLERLLREFQQEHVHMSIVKGEDGNIKGLVTMDDVLEELFGEISE